MGFHLFNVFLLHDCWMGEWIFLISFLSINRLIGLTRAEMRIKWWGELVW